MQTLREYMAIIVFIVAVIVGVCSGALFYVSARIDHRYDI
jgi:uncharacterized protein YneF (UPF0154 family)